MAEWKEYTVADVISTVIDHRGKTPKKLGGDWSDSGYRALSAKNIKTGKIIQSNSIRYVSEDMYKSWMKKEIQRGDILITSEAPFGQIYYWDSDEKIVLSQRLFAIRVNQYFYPKYIYFYMTSAFFQAELDGRATGTTVVGLRQPELLKCKILAPEYQEQKEIADTLWCLEQKINSNEVINKNLEQQIQELYKEWFITNREANWQRIPLSDIIFFQEGPGIRNWQYVEDGVKFINIRCINNGLIDTSTANKISLEEASGKYSHFMLEPYDIVMSCSGTLGRYAIVLPQNLPLCLNTSVIRFRPKQYKDDYSFVYGYMTSKEFLNQQITMANGSAQVNFGPTHLKKIEIVEPPVETRKKFNDLVFPLIETQISLRAENTRLVEIRDTLLPCLMSGEIDVSEVEI